ncbi:MAG: (2Fe-2S)-binding protein [Thermomicrobiales bacterium]|nr:(2Fe-2S)-binding protein [Thermomicrobiales bacterium]
MSESVTPAACFICRCEELSDQDLRDAVAAGARTINDVKRRTRAGMGICQGVYCLDHVARIIAEETGEARARIVPMTARPPVRMLTLGALAGENSDR